MSRFSDQIRDEYGRTVPGVAIYVYKWDAYAQVAGDLETLTDDLAAPLANPLTSDADGLYYFNSLDGQKLLEFHYGGKDQLRELILVGALPVPEATFAGLFINAAALTIPVGMDLIVTTGYSSLDVGAAVYTADAAVNTAYVAANPRSSFISLNNRGFRLSLEQDITAEMLGDVSVDATAAILAALALVGPGGAVNLGAKTYLISGTLVLSQNGQKLIGVGAGGLHDIGTQIVAPCRLKWVGTLGGTMVRVKSVTSQALTNNVVRGIFFDGNNGLAAVGLNTVGCRLGTFEVIGAHCTTALYKPDPDPALGEAAGNTENRVRVSGYQTNVGDGVHVLETGTATWNCSQDTYELISGSYVNGPTVIIGGSDSQTFESIKLYSADASPGVVLKAGATLNQTARNNMFHYLAVTNATIPVVAEGTGDNTNASYENNILFLDTANNPNLPSVHTGASLWWGTVKSPLGLRSFTAAAGSLVQQHTSGLIVQSGVSNSIAAGGNQAITLTKALSANPTNVTITPKTAGMLHHAVCTTTTLTITNDGGSATDFYWRVEGI